MKYATSSALRLVTNRPWKFSRNLTIRCREPSRSFTSFVALVRSRFFNTSPCRRCSAFPSNSPCLFSKFKRRSTSPSKSSALIFAMSALPDADVAAFSSLVRVMFVSLLARIRISLSWLAEVALSTFFAKPISSSVIDSTAFKARL